MWEVLLGYPREAWDAGSLVFSNVSDPLWWWLGAGVVTVLIAASAALGRLTRGWRAWQRITIGSLQIGTALGVLALLAGPALQTYTLQPGANQVAVLVDASGSMTFPDTTEEGAPARLDAARSLVERELLSVLEPLAEVALFRFDTATARLDSVEELVSNGAGTHLIDATDAVLSSFAGTPLAALVLLSDGADNRLRGVPDTALLAAHGVPVHSIGFGPTSLPGEVQLTDVNVAADAPPRSRVTARIVVDHASPGEALLKVRDAGTLIATRPLSLPASSPTVRTEISFDSGRAGIRELSFEIEPPAGDRLAANNRLERLLSVSERRRRILYLEGEPRWEYKFLRRAVEGDDVLSLVSWLRTSDRKTYRQGVAGDSELGDGFPQTKAELFGYDVVVLGSLAAAALNETQHVWLEAFVSERGGSLLALAGREALDDGRWDVQPLAAALPVQLSRDTAPAYGPTRGQARPTAIGARSPYTQLVDAEGGDGWQSLPPLGDVQRLGELKPAATTLLELVSGDEVKPLLVMQPYGLGTTAVLATASTWRWQMRTAPDDRRHALFWRQLLRQLAETAQQQRAVRLHVDEDGVAIRAWLRDAEYRPLANATAEALVTHADRTSNRVRLAPGPVPGLLAGRYVPTGDGVQRVDVTLTDATGETETVTRFVRVGTEDREHFSPIRNQALLKRVAEVTGGRYLEPAEVGELATLLSFSGTGIRSVQVLPLWQAPLWFALLILLKLGEWGLRRHWGRI